MAKRKPLKTASLDIEHQYLAQGHRCIVGVDEAGRGAWAGPVAAGAVCLPIENPHLREILEGVRDSKELTPYRRAAVVEIIKTTAIAWGVGSASSSEIDRIGIVPATCLAMGRALEMLMAHTPDFQPDVLFTDYLKWADAPLDCPQNNIKYGDKLSLTVAAASILAKTWRDEHMRQLETTYPGYHFAQHKGYGTLKHQAALKTLGATPIHRKSFAPIRNLGQLT